MSSLAEYNLRNLLNVIHLDDGSHTEAVGLTQSTVDAAAELARLRKHPVIATCNDCGHCTRLYPQGAECWHPKSSVSLHLHVAVDWKAPPPTDCPLRGAK